MYVGRLIKYTSQECKRTQKNVHTVDVKKYL